MSYAHRASFILFSDFDEESKSIGRWLEKKKMIKLY
jgi:hypothetical protein